MVEKGAAQHRVWVKKRKKGIPNRDQGPSTWVGGGVGGMDSLLKSRWAL